MLQMAGRQLRGPVWRRVERNACRPRVDLARIDVPALLVRLASVKAAEGVAEHAALRADRNDATGDMRRVLHVMAERRLRDLGGRGTVRVGDGAERGIAERRGVDVADGLV